MFIVVLSLVVFVVSCKFLVIVLYVCFLFVFIVYSIVVLYIHFLFMCIVLFRALLKTSLLTDAVYPLNSLNHEIKSITDPSMFCLKRKLHLYRYIVKKENL